MLLGLMVHQTNAQLDKNYFAVEAGYNLISFKGDLNANSKITRFNNFKKGVDIGAQKRLNNLLGVSANFLYGKLGQQDFETNSGLNFESKIYNFNLQAVVFFDNGFIFKRDIGISPYFKVGVGILSFNPYSDLKDANGNTYYFWSNGLIMNTNENNEQATNATRLDRDYKYETQLASSQTTLNIPLSLGFTAKISKNIGFNVEASYNLTTSDKIDNIVSGGKDKFMASKVGLVYAFGKGNKEEEHQIIEDFDFDVFHKHDTDNDGVADFHDHCQNTPEGVTVDKKGCPLDDDMDGVPNYMDKEPDTKAGSHVDENGVSISDDDFLNQHLAKDSAMIFNRIKDLNEAPSLETLKEVDEQIRKHVISGEKKLILPEKFKPADSNNDGIIQSEEMLNAVDGFLDGELDMSIKTLFELIDYFFEQ